jgi:hypothetical protein
MNKLSKEIARQAGYNPSWGTKADREECFDIEVFAELIVRECADVAGRMDVGRLVLRHFGLKEVD